MSPLDALGMFAAAVCAGLLGSMLGLGGGIIIIPVLTLIYGLDIRHAAATSLLCVVATSTTGAAAYMKLGLADLRLGLLLELPTVIGALLGGTVAFLIPTMALQALFALLLCYTAYAMWRDSRRTGAPAVATETPSKHSCMQGRYRDPATGSTVTYQVHHLPWGMLASTLAGVVSGLLGVGGGIIKVPVMRLKMGVPMKVASATSTFMIGITAATSVVLYFQQGAVQLPVTAMCALGILAGAAIGPRLAARMRPTLLQRIFIILILLTAVQMLWRAWQGATP